MNLESVVKVFNKLMMPWKNRILLMIGRGVILATKDSTSIQQVQVTLLADEVKDQVESMGHFGFASHAPKGSDAVMLSVGANRDHGIIIATESREFRFKNLGEGEVAIYSKDGDFVHLKNGNVIDVKTKTLNINAETVVNITTPTTNITGDVNIGGDAQVDKNVTVTQNVTATGDVTGNNLIGTTGVSAPQVAATTGLTVAGSNYADHTHDYEDDNGTTTTTKSTQGVN